jgi:flavorubredoxin
MIEFVIFFILAGSIAITAWVELHEVVSEVKVLSPESDKGTALVIYQKGLRDFAPKVAFAFANGLVFTGWRVEITTVSPNAPTHISSYDLLVLVWPTYMFSPSLPIRKYLRRIGDLEEKRIIIICTAAGAPLGSCEKMKNLVQAAHGSIEKSLTLFTMRPNDGNGDPFKIATRVGKEIPLQKKEKNS